MYNLPLAMTGWDQAITLKPVGVGKVEPLQPVELREQPVDVDPLGRNWCPVIDRVEGLKVMPDWRDDWGGGSQLMSAWDLLC